MMHCTMWAVLGYVENEDDWSIDDISEVGGSFIYSLSVINDQPSAFCLWLGSWVQQLSFLSTENSDADKQGKRVSIMAPKSHQWMRRHTY